MSVNVATAVHRPNKKLASLATCYGVTASDWAGSVQAGAAGSLWHQVRQPLLLKQHAHQTVRGLPHSEERAAAVHEGRSLLSQLSFACGLVCMVVVAALARTRAARDPFLPYVLSKRLVLQDRLLLLTF